MLEPSLIHLLRKYVLGSISSVDKIFVESLLQSNPDAQVELKKKYNFYPVESEYHKLKIMVQHLEDLEIESILKRVYQYQLTHNEIFQRFTGFTNSENVKSNLPIKFLPIELFKSHIIKTGIWTSDDYFLSSGTSGQSRSRHQIRDHGWYWDNSWQIFSEQILSFHQIDLSTFKILALLPGYLENEHSSLVSMIKGFCYKKSLNTSEVFFADTDQLKIQIDQTLASGQQIVLFGVSFALVDFADKYSIHHPDLFIIETGGMKTDRRAITKLEILERLRHSFSNSNIMSEYGMTELFSQSYALDGVNYKCPKTMRVVVTELDDPLQEARDGKRGRINIIDLANLDSCSFIQTGDAGINNGDGTFQVLGRIEEEELRGCNFMYNEQE